MEMESVTKLLAKVDYGKLGNCHVHLHLAQDFNEWREYLMLSR